MVSVRNKVSPCSNLLKIGSFPLVIALILQCISIGTHNWIFYRNAFGSDFNAGLWYICSYTNNINVARNSDYVCLSLSMFDTEAWLKAVQALECFGLVTIIISGVLICMQHCGARSTKKMKMFRIALVALAGASIIIGVIIHGIRMVPFKNYIFFDSHLNYSFGLGATAGILCFIDSGYLFYDVICTKRNGLSVDYQVHHVNQPHSNIIDTPLHTGVVTVGQGAGFTCPPPYSSLYQPHSNIIETPLHTGVVTVGQGPGFIFVSMRTSTGQQTTTPTILESGQHNCAPPPYCAVAPMNAPPPYCAVDPMNANYV